MAGMSDNPDKEAKKWFILTMIGTILYIAATYGFVVSQEVEPTDEQVRDMESYD